MTATLVTAYLGQGLAAARPAAPALATGTVGWWYSTDTGVMSYYANGAWANASVQAPVFHPGYSALKAAAKFWYPATATAQGGNNTATGALYAAPYFSPVAQVFTKIGIAMATSSTGHCRLGVYADNGGQPGALILDCGQLTYAAASGLQQLSGLTINVSKGWSWLAYTSDATMGVNCNNSGGFGPYLMGSTSGSAVAAIGGYSGTFVYGALPGTFPAPLTDVSACPAPSLQF